MTSKRSNSRRTGRKPISAYAKLRKQHYDKQYRLDMAIFGYSRWDERMREAGRVNDAGEIARLRDEKGHFITGYRSPSRTSEEEINLFLDDLVGASPSVRYCQTCRQRTIHCRCWDEVPRFAFTKTQLGNYDASHFSDCIEFPTVEKMLSDIGNSDCPTALSEMLLKLKNTFNGEES